MSNYSPEFAKVPVPNHEGECQFVRFHRFLEACSVPGCKVARMSRDWIEEMKAKHLRAPDRDGESLG